MSSSFVSSNFAAYSPIRSVGSGRHGHVVRDAKTLPPVTSLINKTAYLPAGDASFWQAAKPV